MRNLSKKWGTAAAGVGLVMAGLAITPSAASAAPTPNDGCGNRADHGIACIFPQSGGFDASFTAYAAGNPDFNLFCDNGNWFGDEGQFHAERGETRTYFFAVGKQGTCHLEVAFSDGIVFRTSNATN